MLTTFDEFESNVRYYCRRWPTVFSSAQGATLVDEHGTQYLDFFAGAGALSYGHNNPLFVELAISHLRSNKLLHSLDTFTVEKRAFLEAMEQHILRPRQLDMVVQTVGPTGATAVEAALLAPHATSRGLDIIRLVAPTTDDARLPHVLEGSSGFVYYVSITGITGTRTASAEQLRAAIPRVRAHTDLPIAIGFGVRTPEQAAEAVRSGDAAVVASALIDTLFANLDEQGRARPEAVRRVLDQVRGLAEGVRNARNGG